jgi:hypothetical protein
MSPIMGMTRGTRPDRYIKEPSSAAFTAGIVTTDRRLTTPTMTMAPSRRREVTKPRDQPDTTDHPASQDVRGTWASSQGADPPRHSASCRGIFAGNLPPMRPRAWSQCVGELLGRKPSPAPEAFLSHSGPPDGR